ncbi:MAG: hypothetical protein AAF761_05140 [Pseudomonadota bacterium]
MTRSFKKIALGLICGVGLSACVTQEDFEASVDARMGQPDFSFVQLWGTPTETYDTSGRRFLGWTRTTTMTLPSTPPSFYYGGAGRIYAVGYSERTVTRTCQITVEFARAGRNWVSKRWGYRGRGCF